MNDRIAGHLWICLSLIVFEKTPVAPTSGVFDFFAYLFAKDTNQDLLINRNISAGV